MIKNKTRKTEISREYKMCSTSFSKAIGLMFRIKPKTLVFEFRSEKIVSLHMFFVAFPIDVLFLDNKKKVVEIKKKFMPFSFYTPKNKAKYIIELPEGDAAMSRTAVGDIIDF